MHPRNKHHGRYDFKQLSAANPILEKFVKPSIYGELSIDFADPKAVKALNQALLKLHYNIVDWDIPAQFLCPPIPGRADYIHHLHDLLGDKNKSVCVLDIGIGANAIYPLIGHQEYGWHFVGADIDQKAITNAQRILDANTGLNQAIQLRLQTKPSNIFKGIIQPQDFFELSMCNPPFHASLEEAQAGTQRKLNKLAGNAGKRTNPSKTSPKLNFGGLSHELYCEGGELAFIKTMMTESHEFKQQCRWFTSLVSKASNLPSLYKTLKTINAKQVKTIEMQQGNKQSRLLAWSFFSASL